jgi:hypothetical protein
LDECLQHNALAQRPRIRDARGIPRTLRNHASPTEITGRITGPVLDSQVRVGQITKPDDGVILKQYRL